MTADLLRRFAPRLEVRSTAQGGDGRTIEGIAVPYGVVQRIDDTLTEVFARGAFAHQITAPFRVPLYRGHETHGGALIGRATELREDAAGLWGSWRVSRTSDGDDVLELIADGLLEELSVGFRERRNGNRVLPDGTVERRQADLVEVAIVRQGAYGHHAAVSAVRAHGCRCAAAPRPGLAEAERLLAALPPLPA